MSTELGDASKLFRHLLFIFLKRCVPVKSSGAGERCVPVKSSGADTNGVCVRLPQKVGVFNLCLHRGDR